MEPGVRKLVLLRHAEAVDTPPGKTDFDRVLTAFGRDQAIMAGTSLSRRGVRPDLVVSSPAPRALETANLAASQIGVGQTSILQDRRIYSGGRRDLVLCLEAAAAQAESVMLVGHNPTLSELGAWLGGLSQTWNLDKACAAGFELQGRWDALKPGAGKLLWESPGA